MSTPTPLTVAGTWVEAVLLAPVSWVVWFCQQPWDPLAEACKCAHHTLAALPQAVSLSCLSLSTHHSWTGTAALLHMEPDALGHLLWLLLAHSQLWWTHGVGGPCTQEAEIATPCKTICYNSDDDICEWAKCTVRQEAYWNLLPLGTT